MKNKLTILIFATALCFNTTAWGMEIKKSKKIKMTLTKNKIFNYDSKNNNTLLRIEQTPCIEVNFFLNAHVPILYSTSTNPHKHMLKSGFSAYDNSAFIRPWFKAANPISDDTRRLMSFPLYIPVETIIWKNTNDIIYHTVNGLSIKLICKDDNKIPFAETRDQLIKNFKHNPQSPSIDEDSGFYASPKADILIAQEKLTSDAEGTITHGINGYKFDRMAFEEMKKNSDNSNNSKFNIGKCVLHRQLTGKK